MTIPGGAQLNSKRMEQYSPKYPTHYTSACGIEIQANAKSYKDFSTMGIGCCILGYCDIDVEDAVTNAVHSGNMTSLNTVKEQELAEELGGLHPHYSYVRYFKTGGEALAAAVRVARTKSQWDRVISIGYHGWHDWYLAGNIRNDRRVTSHLNITTHMGVPKSLIGRNTFSQHNDAAMLDEILEAGKYEFAAIVFEYARYEMPSEKWMRVLKKAQDRGIVLIADEVTTGWRVVFGGMHRKYMDIFTPNMVVYGKAISNGYPFACVLGDRVMRCFEDTFISSTYWTESISMAAALATIRSLNKQSYCDRNAKQAIVGRALVEKHGAELSGIPGLMHYTFPDMTRQEWCERMLERGYLVTDNLYLSFAHTLTDIHEFMGAI